MSLFELPLIINDDDHPMQTQIEKKFGKEMSVTVLSRCVLANRLFGHFLLGAGRSPARYKKYASGSLPNMTYGPL